MSTLCPCHSKQPYATCCAPLHRGEPAPTALALMRSRYSAYALALIDYLLWTTHPRNPHVATRDQLAAFARSTSFVGLDILSATKDTVTFKAYLKQGGNDVSFTEQSLFIFEEGRWLWLDSTRLS